MLLTSWNAYSLSLTFRVSVSRYSVCILSQDFTQDPPSTHSLALGNLSWSMSQHNSPVFSSPDRASPCAILNTLALLFSSPQRFFPSLISLTFPSQLLSLCYILSSFWLLLLISVLLDYSVHRQTNSLNSLSHCGFNLAMTLPFTSNIPCTTRHCSHTPIYSAKELNHFQIIICS